MKKRFALALLCLLGSIAAPAAEPQGIQADGDRAPAFDPWERRINSDGLLELEWDDLIPADFNPDTLYQDITAKYGLEELDDNDPRARQVMTEIRQAWNHAPAVESLDGREVRMPGLVVPLEGQAEALSEFLLVPYFGACIHVPPPPSNQIVYVRKLGDKAKVEKIFDAVWVSGTMRLEHQSNEMGHASYTIEARKVEPYE